MKKFTKNFEQINNINKKFKHIRIFENEVIIKNNSDVSKFFSKLFESREMAHIYHLQIKDKGSNSVHITLNEYYDKIIDMIDTLIETYQGQYGIVEEYSVIDTSDTKSKNPIDYFKELAKYIRENRVNIPTEDTHLHSLIDDIVILIYQTLYKLENLK